MSEEGRTLPIICKPSSKIGAPTPVGKVRPVLTVVPGVADADDPHRRDSAVLIDELVREGARRMLAEALQAEVDAYIEQFIGERDADGRRLVVRNGTHQPREVLTSAGAVEVTVPHGEGSYPPGDLSALKQDRRANAGREGTTRAQRSCRGVPRSR